LDKLNYRQVVVLSVEEDVNGQEFAARFEQLRLSKKIHVQKFVELSMDDEQRLGETISEKLKPTTANTILLFARRMHAEKIFAYSNQFTKAGRVWLINEAASHATNLPAGFLSIKMRQNGKKSNLL
jgi:hypothetical protein